MTRAPRPDAAPADRTPAELFEAWLADPLAPAVRPYWTGNLAAEAGEFRSDAVGNLRRFHAKDPDARAVADAARAALDAGLVLLTQRRLGDGRWQYLATRRNRPPQGDRDR